MMSFFRNKIAAFSFVAFFVLTMTVLPFSPTFQYEKPLEIQIVDAKGGGPCVSAAGEPCAGFFAQAANISQNTISAVQNSITAWATESLQLKEFTLDGIAWALINIALETLIETVIDWVNSGFQEGGLSRAAYVQNLSGRLRALGDDLFSRFITSSPFAFLCSPFQLDISTLMQDQYLAGREDEAKGFSPQCTMEDVVSNIQGFGISYNGSAISPDINTVSNTSSFIEKGGFAWWLGATSQQQNNVYGAYASAQTALAISMKNAKGQEVELLKWGQGFLSMKKCTDNNDPSTCTIVTPGQVIESQLNKALFGGQERLTIADEINELIAALLAQIAQHVMGGIAGMFGSTVDAFGSGGDAFDAIDTSEIYGYSSETELGTAATTNTEDYIEEEQKIVDMVNDARDARNDAVNDLGISLALPTELTDARSTANTNISEAEGKITQLELLTTAYNNSEDPVERAEIMGQITTLTSEMRTDYVASETTATINTSLTPDLRSFYEDLAQEITNAGGNPSDYIPSQYL